MKVFVSGFARSFISGQPIADATITVLEDETLKFQTDSSGKFGPFEWTSGTPITLVFEKPGSFWSGYKTIQSATITVPPDGINNENFLKNISFQVPSNMAYKLLTFGIGGIEDPKACQIAATVTPPNTDMDDIPQGVEGVTVSLYPTASLNPKIDARTFYFGIIPIIHKTNPFTRTLKSTSKDGGVVFINVPPGDYTMKAEKDDILFSEVEIKAREGMIVNASPPFGPAMQQMPKVVEKEKKTNQFSFFQPAVILGFTVGVVTAITLGHSRFEP